MKKQTLVIAFLFALVNLTTIHAQTTFEAPENPVLKTKQDFLKFEPQIIQAAKWLEETDLDKEPEKRKKVSAFVVQYVSDCPTMNLVINEPLVKIYDKNSPLLTVFIANYAKNFIENKTTATKLTATKAGILSMMTVYNKKINIVKSKEMDKLINLAEMDLLDDYIKDKFKQ
ncbi:hypothetical protein OX284_000740 [Flavobacterium sp. SUN046]|uniref:hypothetical protein n=1 Tax=Flavobacterium sp. SUN046 TaxID=3002440 RepID=UPI002DBA8FAC|nr:hypothetical protein [Flavobacterium sp. SUN046]MEC4047940.1 hypothetical protein [Flavobacterium sp. SUN046]